MNRDVLEGKWRQARGQMKDWWGQLTDDDLDRVEGNWDKLIGLLQEKYGYTKQQAESEVDRRMTDFDTQYATRRPPTDRSTGQHDRTM